MSAESCCISDSRTCCCNGHGVWLNTCCGFTFSQMKTTRLKSEADRAWRNKSGVLQLVSGIHTSITNHSNYSFSISVAQKYYSIWKQEWTKPMDVISLSFFPIIIGLGTMIYTKILLHHHNFTHLIWYNAQWDMLCTHYGHYTTEDRQREGEKGGGEIDRHTCK